MGVICKKFPLTERSKLLDKQQEIASIYIFIINYCIYDKGIRSIDGELL